MIPSRKHFGLSIGQQSFLIQNSIPAAIVRAKPGKLECRVDVRPTRISRNYKLQITYEIGKHPVSVVKSPDLGELATGEKIPHLWRVDPFELCLYYHQNREWNPRMHLSRTIFPWCLEWLFHFECWLGTGHWDGGGTNHQTSQ